MENIKIISDNGVEINVNGIFYVFNNKYYFIYTIGEIDENGYVILYIVQVGKEIKNTPTGPIDTGYMLGMEIIDQEEWKNIQNLITQIVEDKKRGTHNPEIQYLPINMLVNLKIVSKNKFRLMKNIVENNFKLLLGNNSENNINSLNQLSTNEQQRFMSTDIQNGGIHSEVANLQNESVERSSEVIIDYRSSFFEEQEKNKELEEELSKLKEKLETIKNIIE